MGNQEILLEILYDIFEEESKHNEITHQISFDCPVCSYDIKGLDTGDGKGNLEINYGKHVYKCWSCAETHSTHGHLGKLIDQYGSKENKKIYNLIREDQTDYKDKKEYKKLKLPKEFKRFDEVSDFFPEKKRALNYLSNRGINSNIINKFNIGFCHEGDYSGRIIVPSYDRENNLNYFVARSWNSKNRVKYKNPVYPKDKLIFNESLIDWKEDIWLVEGVFDSFFIENSIPLLGKYVNDNLFETLYDKCGKGVVVCLDSDAWDDATKIYHRLNGGRLYDKIKIVKLIEGYDVADLKGEIKDEYFFNIK